MSFETWREDVPKEATASPRVQVTPRLHFGFSPPECGNSKWEIAKGEILSAWIYQRLIPFGVC